jgi:hypothetical protein
MSYRSSAKLLAPVTLRAALAYMSCVNRLRRRSIPGIQKTLNPIFFRIDSIMYCIAVISNITLRYTGFPLGGNEVFGVVFLLAK